MNNVDKPLLFVLICFMLAFGVSIAKIDELNKIIELAPVCEAYGLTEKTHAFDVKSEIITVQCE